MAAEIVDVAEGLWVWRVDHPDWNPEADWAPAVTSTWVASEGVAAVVDALDPGEDGAEVWARLDARPPSVAAILKPDHVPETEIEAIEPGSELPGGLVALYDGRGRNETPLWAPGPRALLFADALTERDGELRVWGTPWHSERVLPALRAMLELPFEHVIVSHGEPVHDRAAFECAL